MKNLDTKQSNEKRILEEAEKIIKHVNQTNSSSNTNSKKIKQTKLEDSPKKQKDSQSLKNIKPINLKKKIILIITFIIIFTLIILSFIFGLITSKSNKIIAGISINGVDVSNLTRDEALQKLNLQLSRNIANEITLTHNDYSTTLNLANLKSSFDFETALNEAYDIGRSENNVFNNNKKVITTFFAKNNITPTVSYDESILSSEIERINNELPDKVVNSSYKIEDNKLIISNSANGNRVSTNELSNNIKNCILNNTNSINIPVEQFEAATVDIEAIYNEVHKDAVDAYYSTNPYEIHKEEMA